MCTLDINQKRPLHNMFIYSSFSDSVYWPYLNFIWYEKIRREFFFELNFFEEMDDRKIRL